MRGRLLVPVVLLAAAAPAAPARASIVDVPKAAHGGCSLDIARVDHTCVFTLLPGEVWVDALVWSGEGRATLDCPRSGYSAVYGGGVGSEYDEFAAQADLCELYVDARGGRMSVDVYPGR